MPNVTLNSVSFSDSIMLAISSPSTARRAPQRVIPLGPKHVGENVEGANGYETVVRREATSGTLAVKRAWRLEWDLVPEGTRAAVETVQLLGTAFTAVLPSGTYTVQCKLDELEQTPRETIPGGIIYWDVKLTIYKVGV